jgi:hypothetical protein
VQLSARADSTTITTAGLPMAGLAPSTTYHWVACFDAPADAGIEDCSTPRTFTTAAAAQTSTGGGSGGDDTGTVTPRPPVNPSLASITVAPGAGSRLAGIGRAGVVKLRLPATIATGTTVRVSLAVSAAQARTLGLRVPRGARTVVIGTGSAVTRQSVAASVSIRLTRAAKLAFVRAGSSRSAIRIVRASATVQLTLAGLSAPKLVKPLTLRR